MKVILKNIYGSFADKVDYDKFINEIKSNDYYYYWLLKRYDLETGEVKNKLREIADEHNMTIGQVAYRLRREERRLRFPFTFTKVKL